MWGTSPGGWPRESGQVESGGARGAPGGGARSSGRSGEVWCMAGWRTGGSVTPSTLIAGAANWTGQDWTRAACSTSSVPCPW